MAPPAVGRLKDARAVGSLVVSLLALASFACSAPPPEAGGSSGPRPVTPSTTASEDRLEKLVVATSTAVRFEASDGVALEGRLFGSGETGVVLSHMGEPLNSQADWFSFAARLAEEGYRALTYNRRGVCPGDLAGCSEGVDSYGEHWRDVVGAVRFLEDEGADEVFLAGASIGAMASLYAASRPGVDVAGVIWIAGLRDASGYLFHRRDVRRLRIPKLFVSADRDPYLAEDDARLLDRWSAPPSNLEIIPSEEHGTAMLDEPGPARTQLQLSILRFLVRYRET